MKSKERQKITEALAMTQALADRIDSSVIAALIMEALLPQQEPTPGAVHYRMKAQRWLVLLLDSEPGMSLQQLAERVQGLAAISQHIKEEVGGLSARLQLVARQA